VPGLVWWRWHVGPAGHDGRVGDAVALGGAKGIEHVLRTLLAEADLIMAVDGYPALADLTPEALRRVTVRPLSQVSDALGATP
jgi:hypothetical protein